MDKKPWLNRILLSLSVFCFSMLFFSFSVEARTVKAGKAFVIDEPSSVTGESRYKCYNCFATFDDYESRYDEDLEYWQSCCPSCGDPYSVYENYDANEQEGWILCCVELYKYKPRKLIKYYYSTTENDDFYRRITIKKPGKYLLRYEYEHYEYYQESETEYEKETLNVLGEVKFRPNKGVLPASKLSRWKKQGAKIGKLPKPKRKGYKFQGWYTKKKGGKKISKNTKVNFTKSYKKYFAHWKKVKKS